MATRNVVPRATNEGQIGTSTKQWSDGFFVGFHVDGLSFGNNALVPDVDSTNSLGDSTHRFNNIYAVNVIGTASVAKYADLAEKYTCKDEFLPTGTVMSISDSDFEVEVCDEDACDCVAGVISASPAYMMNSESKGQIVGLIGKVPVRITGPIRKKQAIVSAGKGLARACETHSDYNFKLGFAIEENLDPGEKLVMCIIK